jgi:hypothetical protein
MLNWRDIMKVFDIVENSPFADMEETSAKESYENKIYAINQQEQMLVDKIRVCVSTEQEKVYVTDATVTKLPPTLTAQIEKDKNAFITFVLAADTPSQRSKIWIRKDTPTLVKRIRAIIDRHNKLSNMRAEFAGKLAALNQPTSSK